MKELYPCSGCEWAGVPLKVPWIFALRMRRVDVKPRPFLVRSVVHWSHQRRFHLESETTWAIFFLPSFQQAFRQLAFRGVRSPINSREFASTKRKKIEDVRGFSFDLKPDILTYRLISA
uniref:Uncharacterized protein n=1 Tax=Vespula pensylvanica TaxID=30213 RepID=A0A834UDI6_VESPE|nr:hypothetical protein H0235_005016 [Vespula pensylvanica]